MESWQEFINSLEIDLPDGLESPQIESEAEDEETEEKAIREVFVQKIVTEVWVYTDLNDKTMGSQSFQVITTLGNMNFDNFANIISKRKQRRKRN